MTHGPARAGPWCIRGEVVVTDNAGQMGGEKASARPRSTVAGRLRAWFGRRLIDRMRWADGPVHVAYHPDAAYELHELPEFRALYQSWIAGNRRGNGGDLTRLYAFILNIKHCLADGVAGDLAALSDRHVYLFDTFTGFDARDLRDVDGHRAAQFAETSLDAVRRTVGHEVHTTYI